MNSKLNIFAWVLRIAAAGILLQTLFFKFTGAPESIYIFETLGLEPFGRYASGVTELIAAIFLLIPRFNWLGALLALGVMSGAIMSHLTVLGIEVKGDGGLLFTLAIVVFISSAILLFFEREKILGMDSQSVNTMIRGEEVRLDTPPRAFSEGFYPNLMSMYQLAGVEIEPFSWAWSVSTIGEKRAFLKMSGSTFMGFRIPQTNGTIWQSLFDSRTHNIIGDTLRFHREMKNIVNGKDVDLSKLTVGEFLKLGNYTDAFIYDALLPILSMICTCTYKSCKEYPIELAAGYFTRNSSYGQYHSKNGSQDVVRKLSAGCEIKTDVPVLGIWHGSASRRARVKYKENNQVIEEEFDVVVIASQAHTALNLISDITDEEREALSTFGFEYSTVSIHRDPALMPTDKRDWLPMNVILPKEKDQTMFTMWCTCICRCDIHNFLHGVL